MNHSELINTIRSLTLIGALTTLAAACSNEESDETHEHENGVAHTHTPNADHHHEEGVPDLAKAGPNGGRLITSTNPTLEFLLLEDRRMQIIAVDADRKPTPIGDQVVSVIGGDRSDPTEISLSKFDDKLVSDSAFPDGDNLPVVLNIVASPNAEATIEKFYLNLSVCPSCDRYEYACICDH